MGKQIIIEIIDVATGTLSLGTAYLNFRTAKLLSQTKSTIKQKQLQKRRSSAKSKKNKKSTESVWKSQKTGKKSDPVRVFIGLTRPDHDRPA